MSNYFTQHNNGGGWGDGIYQTIDVTRQSTGGKEQSDNTASVHVFLQPTSANTWHQGIYNPAQGPGCSWWVWLCAIVIITPVGATADCRMTLQCPARRWHVCYWSRVWPEHCSSHQHSILRQLPGDSHSCHYTFYILHILCLVSCISIKLELGPERVTSKNTFQSLNILPRTEKSVYGCCENDLTELKWTWSCVDGCFVEP